MRIFWFIAGCVSVIIGLIGAVLPLVPTVPLMILAAFCFARSSETLHQKLLEHPIFGPAIIDWRENGSISKRGKKIASFSILLLPLISYLLNVKTSVLIIQSLVLFAVLTFILTRPTSRR